MARADVEAKLNLDSSGFKKGLAKSKNSLKSWSSGAIGQLAKVGAAFLSIGLIKGIVSLGTSAAETASKFKTIFGPAADEMNRKVRELKKTIPATTAEMQNALSTFAAMGKAFGLNSEAANEFSLNMVKIAGDLASFHDMKAEDAFLKIRSAISGEFEPMKQLGIVMNEAIIKQEALNLAIWDGTGQMSAAQKAIAVQSILVKQMGAAQGDAAATAESAANKIKFLMSRLTDLGTEIGTNVLPAIVSVVEALGWVVTKAKSASEAVGTFLGEKVFGTGPDEYEAFLAKAKELLKEEGKLTGKRGDKKKIEKRAKALNAEFNEQQKIRKEEKKAANEKIKGEQKTTDTITDPKRKKAGEDYIASLKKQIELAGKLNGINGAAKPGTSGTSGTSTGSDGDATAGIITDKQKRAAEREDRKKASEARRAMTRAVAMESGAGERARKSSRDDRFLNRESAVGLVGTMAGRDGPLPMDIKGSPTATQKAGGGSEKGAATDNEYLKSIDKRLEKLDAALTE